MCIFSFRSSATNGPIKPHILPKRQPFISSCTTTYLSCTPQRPTTSLPRLPSCTGTRAFPPTRPVSRTVRTPTGNALRPTWTLSCRPKGTLSCCSSSPTSRGLPRSSPALSKTGSPQASPQGFSPQRTPSRACQTGRRIDGDDNKKSQKEAERSSRWRSKIRTCLKGETFLLIKLSVLIDTFN